MARKIFNIITTVILILLIVFVVFLFIMRASGKTPSIFGYQVLRVTTGSMEPTLMVGDVILVKSTPPEDIHKGDIITYESVEGSTEGKLITHRVVSEPQRAGDLYYIQTQGDFEGAALDPLVEYSHVKGKYLHKLQFIDKLYSFFFTPYGIIIFIFVIVALFGYELISLIISYKSLDEHDDAEPPDPKEEPAEHE